MPALLPGNSGMHRIVRQESSVASKGGACGQTGRRLWKSAEVDDRIPLFRVWAEHRGAPWPKLLDFWGLPNLQVINRTLTPQNAPSRRGTVVPHAFLKLNSPEI